MIDAIERKINIVNSDKYSPVLFKLSLDEFYDVLIPKQRDIYLRIKNIFHDNFNPEGMKPYQIFTASDDGFDLKMTKSLKDIRFEYRGPNDKPIYEFLEKNKIDEPAVIQ